MSVRITGGALRGRVVEVPSVAGVRPTAARTREALFSMLGQHLDGRSALDAFGGSGLLAIEAASRGAAPITVCERDRRVAAAIRSTCERLGVDADVRVADAGATLSTGSWDLVLLDPPFDDDPVGWLERAADACAWRLVLEHRAGARLPRGVGALEQLRLRRYGHAAVAVYGRRAGAGVPEDQEVP